MIGYDIIGEVILVPVHDSLCAGADVGMTKCCTHLALTIAHAHCNIKVALMS